MKFDAVFQYTGHVGTYQICIFGILLYASMFGADTLFQNFVGGSTMEHWCAVPELEIYPFSQQKLVAIPGSENDQGTYVYESCEKFDLAYGSLTEEDIETWNRTVDLPGGTSTNTSNCGGAWVYNRSLYSETLCSEFNLVCARRNLVPLPSSMYYIGLMIGAYFFGEISDRFGRKICFFSATAIKFVFGVCLGFAPTFWSYVLFYTIVGFSTGGTYMTGFVIITEITGPLWRSRLCMVYHMAFSLAYVLYSAAAFVCRDWRYLMFIYYGPMGVLFFAYFIIPEPSRWLVQKGKLDQAEKELRKTCQINQRPEPENLRQMVEDIHEEEMRSQADRVKQKTCIDLYKSPILRRWSLAINFHWFTDSLMYYALSLSTSQLAGSVFMNTAIMGVVEFPAILLALFLMDWKLVGRRYTCSFSLVLAGISSLAMVPLLITNNGTGVTVLSFVGKAFVSMAFNGVYLFSSEVFPTEIRNAGMGLASLCARVGGILAPYMGAPLANIWGPLPSIIFGTLGTVSGLLLLLVPETLGKPMCQTLEEAENLGRRSCDENDNTHFKEKNLDNSAYHNHAFSEDSEISKL